jgi:uncharacterized protein YndB with AHSA1/START domain
MHRGMIAGEPDTKSSATGMTLEGREMVLTRAFIASPKQLFEAWTDSENLSRWWGPKSFSNPECRVDPRPGGEYRVVMRSPEGRDFPVTGKILEIEPDERIEMTLSTDEHPPVFQARLNQYRGEDRRDEGLRIHVTVLFEEEDGGTRLVIRNRFDSVVERDADLRLGAYDGWAESLDRLEAILPSM